MKRLRAPLLFMTLAAMGSAQTESPPEWTRLITIQAEARVTRLSGKPWDANDVSIMPPVLPALGAVFFPVAAPAPDMLICIADDARHSRCYHDQRRNALGVPYSLCRDSYTCTLESVPVPENYFGVLVADLDFTGINDFVMAHVVYQGLPDRHRLRQVEKRLLELAAEWHVADSPSEYLSNEFSACTLKDPCTPRGGAGWLGYAVSKTEECGDDISVGIKGADPGQSLPSLNFEAVDVKGECGGVLEFRWSFGDGTSAVAQSRAISHLYDAPARYRVSVEPRCRRQFTVCRGTSITQEFQVK